MLASSPWRRRPREPTCFSLSSRLPRQAHCRCRWMLQCRCRNSSWHWACSEPWEWGETCLVTVFSFVIVRTPANVQCLWNEAVVFSLTTALLTCENGPLPGKYTIQSKIINEMYQMEYNLKEVRSFSDNLQDESSRLAHSGRRHCRWLKTGTACWSWTLSGQGWQGHRQGTRGGRSVLASVSRSPRRRRCRSRGPVRVLGRVISYIIFAVTRRSQRQESHNHPYQKQNKYQYWFVSKL